MHSSPPPEGTFSFTVKLDLKASNFFALLASAADETISQHAESILTSYCEESMGSEAIMARIGRALLNGKGRVAPAAPTSTPVAPAKKAASVNGPDGLPRGCCRTKDGEVVGHAVLRAATLSTQDVGKLLGCSAPLVLRAVKENAVVPFALVGSAKYPRFREVEVEQIDAWLKTSCSKGRSPRTARCECGRFFSRAGLRMHRAYCGRSEKLSLEQR